MVEQRCKPRFCISVCMCTNVTCNLADAGPFSPTMSGVNAGLGPGNIGPQVSSGSTFWYAIYLSYPFRCRAKGVYVRRGRDICGNAHVSITYHTPSITANDWPISPSLLDVSNCRQHEFVPKKDQRLKDQMLHESIEYRRFIYHIV